MPGCGSWNGKWSGQATLYAILKKFGSQKAQLKAKGFIGNHPYSWSDGWRANVEVREVTPIEAKQIQKNSKGFCGYDWMVESILARGKILANHEIEETQAA